MEIWCCMLVHHFVLLEYTITIFFKDSCYLSCLFLSNLLFHFRIVWQCYLQFDILRWPTMAGFCHSTMSHKMLSYIVYVCKDTHKREHIQEPLQWEMRTFNEIIRKIWTMYTKHSIKKVAGTLYCQLPLCLWLWSFSIAFTCYKTQVSLYTNCS